MMKLTSVVVLLLAVAAMAMVAEAGKMYNVQWDFPTGDQYYSAIQGKIYNVGDTLSKYWLYATSISTCRQGPTVVLHSARIVAPRSRAEEHIMICQCPESVRTLIVIVLSLVESFSFD